MVLLSANDPCDEIVTIDLTLTDATSRAFRAAVFVVGMLSLAYIVAAVFRPPGSAFILLCLGRFEYELKLGQRETF